MALDSTIIICTGLIIFSTPDPAVFFLENQMWEWPENYTESLEMECEKGTYSDWYLLDFENLVLFCRKSDGTKHGVWKKLYLNGKVQVQRHYENNIRNGLEKVYHKNGVVAEEGFIVNDELDGDWVFYDERGVIRMMGTYDVGCRIGWWVVYDKNGEQVMGSVYKKCKGTSTEVY
ncbi:MAG: hypothetical protein L3J07_03010 [Candidatus Magasanikbacteria bacterium]|nr:hypothetical protein [Candidatus Magasanikbacteria bacterium]